MGKLYDLIQAHMDAQEYEVSERQVAKAIGITQTALSNWRTPRRLPALQHLEAVARVTGRPLDEVVDAVLIDIGYRQRKRL